MMRQQGWIFKDPQYLAIDGQQITADQLIVTLTVTPEPARLGQKLIIHAVGNIRAVYNIRGFTPLLITVGPEGAAPGKPKHEQLFEHVDGTRVAGGGEWDELKMSFVIHEPPIADIAAGGTF